MQQFKLAEVREPFPPSAVTLGNLDGVHVGHQRLVEELLHQAQADGLTSAVATFAIHPAQVLDPRRIPPALMTLSQKAEVLSDLGVQRMVVIEFTPAQAALTAEAFARDVLVQRLTARVVVVGAGFRFGSGRAGDVAVLRRLGQELGFRVGEVAPVTSGGGLVSSTRVREALLEGDVELARALLGRPFASDGLVVAGDRRGRQLGLPTANLAACAEMVPADGVYAAWFRLQAGPEVWGERRPAVVSVGRRPTFAGRERRVEAHILDFSGELYGQRVRVEYWRRLRAEKRFDDAPALMEQMRGDVAAARAALEAC